MTVLGGLQVDKHGRLANWVIPGERIPGMGGAMDLVTCAKKVVVAMTHTAKGTPKILDKLSLPMTSDRSVDLIVTELAVMKPDEKGLQLLELAPGVTLKEVQALTDTKFFSEGDITTMAI